MRALLAAFAALALVASPVAAFAEGQGQAKKAEAENQGKALAKGKNKTKDASATRSNKGGETRGNTRADQVKDLNQQKKPGG